MFLERGVDARPEETHPSLDKVTAQFTRTFGAEGAAGAGLLNELPNLAGQNEKHDGDDKTSVNAALVGVLAAG
jgi:hypothetical protein